jgi:crotonobetainyl-CoA:carnitine CoA-transferase CaiB-like acyl-CoA transferase
MRIADLPRPDARPQGADTALGGLRVVDFSHFIAGPYCTQLLADLGADVIKIENAARGDDMRALRPPEIGGEAATFLWTNRNKRSVALDLARPEARAVARELIDGADIVVENFSTGVMQRFGLDYASVSATNERLIYCSISAFGREGRLGTRAGFDPIAQAESGFMSLNGDPDHTGLRTGSPVMDISTALSACNAILAAVVARHRLGKGQYVEAVLFDTALTMAGFTPVNYLVSGINPHRAGNGSNSSAPIDVFEAADGPFYLACANDRTFQRLVAEVLGRPELASDPLYATNPLRVANKASLTALLSDFFARERRDALMERMQAAGVPAGPVRTIAEAVASPEAAERRLVSQVPHPTAGAVPNIAPPLRLFGTPVVDPVAAPLLGQHSAEVLSQVLGYTDEQIAGLARTGAVRIAGPGNRT